MTCIQEYTRENKKYEDELEKERLRKKEESKKIIINSLSLIEKLKTKIISSNAKIDSLISSGS